MAFIAVVLNFGRGTPVNAGIATDNSSVFAKVEFISAIPRAVCILARLNAETELSALSLRYVIALGLIKVNKLIPTVVPPRLNRPVEAVNPVAPPSHFNLSV